MRWAWARPLRQLQYSSSTRRPGVPLDHLPAALLRRDTLALLWNPAKTALGTVPIMNRARPALRAAENQAVLQMPPHWQQQCRTAKSAQGPQRLAAVLPQGERKAGSCEELDRPGPPLGGRHAQRRVEGPGAAAAHLWSRLER